MHSAGDAQPKKGAGYFAGRLKEKGVTEDAASQTPTDPTKTDLVSVDQVDPAAKAGQIFEESTKSIASMAGDVSETARLVSSMKEGLERVTKIKDLFEFNPLCDDSGSCTFDGVKFDSNTEQSPPETIESEEKVAEIITKYANSNLSDLKSDADLIREELQQFKNTIKQKESELTQFREKLGEAKQQVMPNLGSAVEFDTTQLQTDDLVQTSPTEFDMATDQDMISFNSIQSGDFAKLSEIQQQELKDGEKKLLELRWKIKKAEIDYEQRKTQTEQVQDLTSKINELESKKESLRLEVKRLENQNKEPKQELRELEEKIAQAKKDYEEKLTAQKEIEDSRSVLEYLKLDKESLKTELEELRAKTKTAEKEYETRRAASEEFEDVRFSVSSLRAEKDTLASELEQMRVKLQKTEAEIEQRQQEKEKLGEFKAIVTHLKLEKESLEQELSDLKSKIKKSEHDYEQKRITTQEMHDVRDVLAYLKPERDSLKSEITQLRDKIQSMEENYDTINAKKRELQLEYDDLKFKIKKLESEYDEKRNSFSHFTR